MIKLLYNSNHIASYRGKCYKCLAKKVNMFTLSGFRQDRLSDTIFLLVLNRRSDAMLVAGIH